MNDKRPCRNEIKACSFVPEANFSNSKTPAGPFQMIVLAREITMAKASFDFEPQSRPIHPAGIPDSTVAAPTSAFSSN